MAARRGIRTDSDASRRLTRPAPLIDCVTFGSPMYSTDPAPDSPILSVFSTWTTTRPAPLTDTRASSLASSAAR